MKIFSDEHIRSLNASIYREVLNAKVGDILTLHPEGKGTYKEPPWLYKHAGVSRDFNSNDIKQCPLNFSAKCFVLRPGISWHWVSVEGKEGYISSLDVVDIKEGNLTAFI